MLFLACNVSNCFKGIVYVQKEDSDTTYGNTTVEVKFNDPLEMRKKFSLMLMVDSEEYYVTDRQGRPYIFNQTNPQTALVKRYNDLSWMIRPDDIQINGKNLLLVYPQGECKIVLEDVLDNDINLYENGAEKIEELLRADKCTEVHFGGLVFNRYAHDERNGGLSLQDNLRLALRVLNFVARRDMAQHFEGRSIIWANLFRVFRKTALKFGTLNDRTLFSVEFVG